MDKDMNMNVNINRHLTVTPQFIQSIKILEMGCYELKEYIEELSVENPVIEIEKNYSEIDNQEKLQRKLEWLDSADEDNRVCNRLFREQEYAESSFGENACLYGRDNSEEPLLDQLNSIKLSKSEYNAAKYIIESLNENGYLEDSTCYISKLLNINEEKIEEIIRIVQSFEPCGIGARNLKECLLIQLRVKGLESSELNVLIDNYLDDLGKNKFEYVSKHMKIPVERVKELFAIIKSLNPRPGAFLNRVENCGYIVPDVIVVKFRDYYDVLLSDFTIPTIKVSRLYKEILESTADEAAKKYIEKKITQANWIIKSIEQRNNTLLNVSKAIVDIQRRFFDKGPAHLCVMVLKDMADMIGIHESTVSRAVSGKYMQSPWGVYKISSFFTHGLSGGHKSGKTPQKIKSVINEIISDENKNKPYSDQRIAELLKERGIEMSRRTVSKYRDEMNIPAASGRRV